MHRAPDGTEHAFQGEYLDIQRPNLLLSTFVYAGAPDNVATETVTFQALDRGTLVVSRSVLPTFEARELYLAAGAERGLEESFRRLDVHSIAIARGIAQ